MAGPLTPALRLDPSWAASFFNSSENHSTTSVLVKTLLDGDAKATCETLASIKSQITVEKDARRSFRENTGIPAIIHIMATNLPEKSIQTTAATILEVLAEDDDAAAEIGDREGVQALVELFCYYRGDLETVRVIVSALQNLTIVAENRARMVEYKVLELLIETMDDLKNDEVLAVYIPGTVANIVFGCDESRVRCGELGAIASFTNGLDIHRASSKVVTQLAFAIRNLVWECAPNLERVIEEHTVDGLLNVLSVHRKCMEVVMQILGALANLVSANAIIRGNMLTEKTVFLDMFHILSFFAAESSLCAVLSFVMFTIAEHDLQHERLYVRLLANQCKEADGYKGITSSLKHAINNRDKDAIGKICHLIHVLCISEDFRLELGRSKVLDMPLKALQEKVFNDEVTISKLLCCIRGVVAGNDEAKLMFRELNGFSTTVEIMKENRKRPRIILKCTQVLDNAVDGQLRTTEQLLDRRDEVTKELQAVMSNFPECPNLQENACSILVKIASISREEALKMVQAGVRPSAELAKSRHVGNPGVESLANQLLSLLVENRSGREGRSSVREHGNARLRSRSRTVQSSSRSRSRAQKSKSPDRMMKLGRNALERAKMKELALKDAGDFQKRPSGSTVDVNSGSGIDINSKCGTRNKISLEPVYE